MRRDVVRPAAGQLGRRAGDAGDEDVEAAETAQQPAVERLFAEGGLLGGKVEHGELLFGYGLGIESGDAVAETGFGRDEFAELQISFESLLEVRCLSLLGFQKPSDFETRPIHPCHVVLDWTEGCAVAEGLPNGSHAFSTRLGNEEEWQGDVRQLLTLKRQCLVQDFGVRQFQDAPPSRAFQQRRCHEKDDVPTPQDRVLQRGSRVGTVLVVVSVNPRIDAR